jgi:DMSO/TMAO reductase YedYZ molybdopterin-dependent catalytic subunit
MQDIITHNNAIRNIVLTLSKLHFQKAAASEITQNLREDPHNLPETVTIGGEPIGQTYVSNFVIYRILGQPRVNIEEWVLTVKGNVKKKIQFT